jgi:hypothetical protein
VADSRARYVDDFCRVLDAAGPRVVFLWLSQRGPDYTPAGKGFIAHSGWFPHLVDRATRDRVLDHARRSRGAGAVRLVEIVSSEGLPEPLFERATGKPAHFLPPEGEASFNRYYPSQVMHDQVAAELLRILRGRLGKRSRFSFLRGR